MQYLQPIRGNDLQTGIQEILVQHVEFKTEKLLSKYLEFQAVSCDLYLQLTEVIQDVVVNTSDINSIFMLQHANFPEFCIKIGKLSLLQGFLTWQEGNYLSSFLAYFDVYYGYNKLV